MKNGQIIMEGMRFFAFHGCYPGERDQGNWFEVNVNIHLPVLNAGLKDDLHEATDYSDVYRIVREEMGIQRYLLETLALRICWRIIDEKKEVSDARVLVKKMNPPLAGEISGTSVIIELTQKEKEKITLHSEDI